MSQTPPPPPSPLHSLLHPFVGFAAKRERNKANLLSCLFHSLWLMGRAQMGPKARGMVSGSLRDYRTSVVACQESASPSETFCLRLCLGLSQRRGLCRQDLCRQDLCRQGEEVRMRRACFLPPCYDCSAPGRRHGP